MNTLTWNKDAFFIDGEQKRLIIADMHYFRIHPADWEQRLDLAVDFGINVVQTYVPWNAHEPREGQFDFSGMLDLAAFLELAQKKGLYVFLRPSPYICSEWDFGGLPAWLLRDKDMVIRTADERYLNKVRAYYEVLVPRFSPYLASNGGPILAVCLENEYGSFGNDGAYIPQLKAMLTALGVDVPFYTTDGPLPHMLAFGRCDSDLFGINYRATPAENEPSEKALRDASDSNPYFIGEYWAGRSMHWGEPFYHRPPEDVPAALADALQRGANVSFYMFSGGTNFGFMGGANYGYSYSPRPGVGARYIPHTTSYDVDAIISENGNPDRKYYLCRDVLDAFLGKPARPHNIPLRRTQGTRVTLTQYAPLFENLETLTSRVTESILPTTMEDMGENYGLMLYTTTVPHFPGARLSIRPIAFQDRCSLFINGQWYSTQTRDRAAITAAAEEEARGTSDFYSRGEPLTVTALVENLGRVNFGYTMPHERKGLTDSLLYSTTRLFRYENRALPLHDLSDLAWQEREGGLLPEKQPYFFKGSFTAATDADTFVEFSGFSHGYIWVNGFNLGRYDSAGPQMTLYVPHGLLREENEIVVLDILSDGRVGEVTLRDSELLEGDSRELQ